MFDKYELREKKLIFERKYSSKDELGAWNYLLENPEVADFVIKKYRFILDKELDKQLLSNEMMRNYYNSVENKMDFLRVFKNE